MTISKYQTQQEMVAKNALHHLELIKPKWSGDIFECAVCPECGKDISTHGDEESGILWACSDPKCRFR